MKIAIDISQIIYEGTGVARYVRECVCALLRNDPQNQYLLFASSMRKREVLYNFYYELRRSYKNVSAKIYPIPQILLNYLWNNLHIIEIEKVIGKVDIFHSSDWVCPPTKSKKVTTVHDLSIYLYPQYSHPTIVATHKRRLHWVKKECDMIITDAYATRDDLINILHIDPIRLEVVYPGIGSEFQKQSEEEIVSAKQKYRLENDYFLSVGTLEPRKNVRTLISAYQRFSKHPLVAASKKKIDLVFVGKTGWGIQPPKVENIHMLGYAHHRDLPALYSGATAFVYPSFYEGFGFPILEAMACGCPVITSNRGSLRELAENFGIFVEPESEQDISFKMIQMYADSDRRNEFIQKALIHARAFTWDRTAKNILALYDKLYRS